MLNGVEVGRVWRQEEQRGAGGCDELCRLWRLVKGRIIQDDEVLGVEAWAQPRLQPGVEDHRIAGALEEQRLFELSIHTGSKQRGSWPSMPGDETVHAVALRRVPIPPGRGRGKAAFIDMDGPFAATNESFSQAQELFPLLRITFVVAYPFFYESRPVYGVRSRCNAGRPGNAALVLLGSDQDALRHDGAARPNPVYEALAGQDACTPYRRA